ncbi:MAG: orotate phosphoribosyltransferase [Micavibrio aeruginosavorus]|uniref:Orotate phosphoribosyltransferase n=1 Tax=Micavibrio aeruginosavorus TaxID=349221 RepID=A0A2W4ZG69_9BACT|nr:MAG: orotate phosphoribosyltransferase [Micavibrio aeruginosavorus]
MSQDIAAAAARILLDTKAVHVNIEDPFTYTSGKRGPVYVDCRRLISFPEARSQLMDFMAAEMKTLDIDYVAGGETAGIPYAAFIAERLNKPMLYIRKKPKGFGKMSQIEGFIDEGRQNIGLVEDVQNFGVSVRIFVDAIRAAGATVEHLFVIFQHGHESSQQNMRDMGLTLHALASWKDVLKVARQDGYFDTATADSVEEYLQNPDKWAADRGFHPVSKEA